ncbi:MAG: hypothetical protein A2268_11140 [Candidatus Raymondbacteria bacterium RifOxyA12_full_50_37]|uniref:Decaprenyl-phosphate phosphoribosyltransferase n=1 Tax=Candidatus Raymondbacteria bacterium RIFOXYD12_FULL_49_13 TaxID=1817890 RepID=A0A1F7F7U2_UNCRA|nr:MAG: hypothetical protein A2268_11140 [Candidatus Raymondbacteria bacterium RifOxyA12_full_50_37]OGJ85566.1 MAG: hypothetical protein A2248_12925 [Candidatus Raymondbacteria bacterium RIFOXYA2_FULL_49_16]OGJ92818.1 MAG: hypothetical protein A2350_16875 [Candidatus Raymondbacteria bacterium RifOxyB12_full_50_8]OGJ95069.1 MAG: hypothetical protein A2453_07625 [Candidatus Raymondbacteria bacterium RIFOXYC2_FULL_50_21]OGK02587.1 MAG: hypothetical protein A2519_12285 [Candidatus Raymondbacteria b
MKSIRSLLASFRIDQWLKNVFVLAPLAFSKHLFNPGYAVPAVVYALLFCFVSSAIYVFNDFIDRERDRLHPGKKDRPLAAGDLPVVLALFTAFVMGAGGLAASFLLSRSAGFVLVLYIVNNILYSLFLKRVAILDVMLIAAGFVLRVLGGAYVIEVEASVWLMLCTFLVSLYLGFCKRRQELVVLAGNETEHRISLSSYTVDFCDHMIAVVSACTVMSYALYTVADETVLKFGTSNLVFSLPFVLYGVFRYKYHITVFSIHKNTSQIFLSDKSLIVNVFLWLLTVLALIYRAQGTL